MFIVRITSYNVCYTKLLRPEREPRYGRLIGRVDALALQAAARPLPSNNVLAAVRKIVGARGDAASTEQAVPSSTALQEISNTSYNFV